MSRYIDADIAKETLKEYCVDHDSAIQYWYDLMGIDDCIDYNVPTADVRENVRGEWRDIQIGNWHGVECTACKIAHDRRDVPRKNGGIVAWDFCPNCGADMRGRTHEIH